jgi:hypothetical protein
MSQAIRISVEFWRCLRNGNGLVLFLMVSGHEFGRAYKIEADLHLKGTPLGIMLQARTKLDDSPATVEVDVDTTGLEPGTYDVAVTFDGEVVGTFPCEVDEPSAVPVLRSQT